jgi:hypothetical protein
MSSKRKEPEPAVAPPAPSPEITILRASYPTPDELTATIAFSLADTELHLLDLARIIAQYAIELAPPGIYVETAEETKSKPFAGLAHFGNGKRAAFTLDRSCAAGVWHGPDRMRIRFIPGKTVVNVTYQRALDLDRPLRVDGRLVALDPTLDEEATACTDFQLMEAVFRAQTENMSSFRANK